MSAQESPDPVSAGFRTVFPHAERTLQDARRLLADLARTDGSPGFPGAVSTYRDFVSQHAKQLHDIAEAIMPWSQTADDDGTSGMPLIVNGYKIGHGPFPASEQEIEKHRVFYGLTYCCLHPMSRADVPGAAMARIRSLEAIDLILSRVAARGDAFHSAADGLTEDNMRILRMVWEFALCPLKEIAKHLGAKPDTKLEQVRHKWVRKLYESGYLANGKAKDGTQGYALTAKGNAAVSRLAKGPEEAEHK